jgi:hypothetical protein
MPPFFSRLAGSSLRSVALSKECDPALQFSDCIIPAEAAARYEKSRRPSSALLSVTESA